MALIDRLAGEPNMIPAHEFTGALFFWVIGEWDRKRVISTFQLRTDDESHLDGLESVLKALHLNKGDGLEYLRKLEQGVIMLQAGHMTKGEVGRMLGI